MNLKSSMLRDETRGKTVETIIPDMVVEPSVK